MTTPDADQTPIAVDDVIRVVGHYEWHHRQIHGLTGTVTDLWPADPALGDDDGQPLYDVTIPGFPTPALLDADEIVRVSEPTG